MPQEQTHVFCGGGSETTRTARVLPSYGPSASYLGGRGPAVASRPGGPPGVFHWRSVVPLADNKRADRRKDQR